MQIIGFNGPSRSGKSYAAIALRERLAFHNTRTLSYVGPVSRHVVELMTELHGSVPHDYELFKDYEFPSGHTGREMLIAVVDGFRKLNPNILIDAMDRQLMAAYMDGVVVVLIENVGYPGEWEAIRSFSSRMLPGDPLPSPILIGFRERRPDSTVSYGGAMEPVFNSALYAHGERFPGDSRISYRDDYTLVNPTLEEIISFLRLQV